LANGDLTLTTPRSVGTLPLLEFNIGFLPTPAMTITFGEISAAGPSHSVRITDAAATGFDYTAGVFTDNVPRVIAGEYSTMLGIIFGAGASTPNQRKSAAINRLFTSGVVTGTMTVA
jgi:hypothetical protein